MSLIKRIIPATGEVLPVLGIGTWKTFDINNSWYPTLEQVLLTIQEDSRTVIDSSPMYGRSEQVVGNITSEMKTGNEFFYATKVWTTGLQEGINQMNASMQKMKRTSMDLIQVHNLVDWKTHLTTLRKWKEDGKIRYIGITHYTDASHEELEKILKTEEIDFVQFNYSILSRHAEKRLLPIATDRGVATIINRPFGEGNLFNKVKGKSLPGWAAENNIDSWSALFLKYIIGHPAVTCVIPATGNPAHAAENVKACSGEIPDNSIREKMAAFIDSL